MGGRQEGVALGEGVTGKRIRGLLGAGHTGGFSLRLCSRVMRTLWRLCFNKRLFKNMCRSSHSGSENTNLTGIHEDAG